MDYVHKTLPSTDYLNFIVDSLHNQTKKLIWRQIVNLPNVIKALRWLKQNNSHYKDINICETVESALIESEININIDEIENDDNNNINVELSSNGIHCTENVPELETSEINNSLLLHMDHNYEIESNFTIQELKSNNKPENAIEKYSMKKAESNFINEREKNLDHLCFPSLFAYGRGSNLIQY